MSNAVQPVEDLDFWRSVLRSLGAEPKSVSQLRGGSGLNHDVIAIGVDDATRRLILVSGEHDGRSAALVQADIQAAFGDYRALTIRPAAVSIAKIAEIVRSALGTSMVTTDMLTALTKDESFMKGSFEPRTSYVKALATKVSVRVLPQVLELIQQIAKLKLTTSALADPNKQELSIDLTEILNYDPAVADRAAGVCAFPFYDFSQESIEAITSSSKESVTEILKSHDIHQFFFPGADQIALGLIDRGAHKREQVLTQLKDAPAIGHPLGELEILAQKLSPLDVLDALQEKKLIVEGEFGFEISPDGQKTRVKVKFKPKEGLISKLLGRLSLKINMKNLLGG